MTFKDEVLYDHLTYHTHLKFDNELRKFLSQIP